MLEVLFLLCKYFDVSFSFNYNFFSFPAPLNTISSYDSFYDFIFCTFTDFKTKSNFYKFVRSLYRDFYSLKSCVSIVCVNSKSIIIYFKDCTTSIIDIKDCFSSSFF